MPLPMLPRTLAREPPGHLGRTSPGQDPRWLAHQPSVTGPRTLPGRPCWADCLSSCVWSSASKPIPAVYSNHQPSVAPHSPNTCIYNKMLNCVSLDFKLAQAGAASAINGFPCVPDPELAPLSGLQLSAVGVGRPASLCNRGPAP